MPKLIRFVEVNGEREWIELQPANLAISFGPRVEFKRVVLQLTDEPVTPQPKIWPQWLVMELGRDSPLFREPSSKDTAVSETDATIPLSGGGRARTRCHFGCLPVGKPLS
jgi:hypothetical protein